MILRPDQLYLSKGTIFMAAPEYSTRRRGARSLSAVHPAIIRELEAGRYESVNHIEQMAIDMGSLLSQVFPELTARAHELRIPNFLGRMRIGGQIVWDGFSLGVFEKAPHWRSDTVRGWAAFAIAVVPHANLNERIRLALPFADDQHFAVREWAWLGARPAILDDPMTAVEELAALTAHPSPRVRRFVSESTRPRGVWSKHLSLFKQEPWRALPLLEPLATDTSRYVQDSVGNWLRDASRTQPNWVADTCYRWQGTYGTDSDRICRLATRLIKILKEF